MRYFEIQFDSIVNSRTNMVICTLTALKKADELLQILRAVTRTYQSIIGAATKLTAADRPYFHIAEDLHHDDDCGSFRMETLSESGLISKSLARLVDHEIDLFIDQNDLWSDRVNHKVCLDAAVTKVETDAR